MNEEQGMEKGIRSLDLISASFFFNYFSIQQNEIKLPTHETSNHLIPFSFSVRLPKP